MDSHEGLQLRERDLIPISEVLEQVLADSYNAYEIFQEALPDLEIEQNWQWYTPHKVWCAKGQYFWTSTRGTRKEKTLYWLHVFDGYFKVAVWFKEKNRDVVINANVSEKTKEIVYNTKSVMNECTFPVVFDVTTEESLIDIYKLIELKKKIEGK